jgi:hypothetical protein
MGAGMGFFEVLTSSCFKSALDGRKLFFPWGVIGKGYVVTSEAAFLRLKRQYVWYMVVGLGLILGVGLLSDFWVFGIAAILIVFYIGWMLYLLPRLQSSHETLSLSESMTTKARVFNVWILWLLTVFSLVFVGLGIFILLIDPGSWLVSVSTIGLFGLCAGYYIRLLVLRRRVS